MSKYLIAIIALLSVVLALFITKNRKLNAKYSTSIENIKAYNQELSGLKSETRAYRLTIDQLNYFNDSLLDEMNKVRKELKVKDKDLKQLQYILSTSSRVDTIRFTDTLFVNPNLNIDTIVGDKWYELKLKLKYPNIIITDPKFVNEKYIVVRLKKETIDPPKKFFLFRWFQKKHSVVEVDVVEKNPYSEVEKKKFIEIIK